ncbi:MAG TPA: YdcF family protein [Tepidisphaeraceae bacterium]
MKACQQSYSRAIAQGLALSLGAFALVNCIGGFYRPTFDANHWWIQCYPAPAMASRLFLLACAGLFLAYTARPGMGMVRRRATLGAVAALGAITLWNALGYYRLLAAGQIRTSVPAPLSLIIFAALAWIGFSLFGVGGDFRRRWHVTLCIPVLALLAFPLMQICFFGRTDYRRPADAIVVFGARTYADGRPSEALADRVRTACSLYQEGLAPKLIFSGGPGDGSVDEPQAMREMAVSLGVPEDAILLDSHGLNTQATVDNTKALLEGEGIHRLLAVSHFYHLPRIKMTYQHAGLEVYTVPAKQERTLARTPFLVMREVAALGVHYCKGLR